MKALIVLGLILLVLGLLSLVRVGGAVDYSAQGLSVKILAGPLHITVFPFPERKKKSSRKEKKPKREAGPAEEAPDKTGGSLELVKQLLPLVSDAAGRLKQKLRVDRLDMDLIVAAPDPALAAIAYGGANAALGMLVPLLENNFQIKERNLRTAVDFDGKSPKIAIRAALTLTIGQGAAFAFHFGVRALKILLAHRKKQGVENI